MIIREVFGKDSRYVAEFLDIGYAEKPWRMGGGLDDARELLLRLIRQVSRWRGPAEGSAEEGEGPVTAHSLGPPVRRCEWCGVSGVELYECYPRGRKRKPALLCQWCRERVYLRPGQSEDALDRAYRGGGFETNRRRH